MTPAAAARTTTGGPTRRSAGAIPEWVLNSITETMTGQLTVEIADLAKLPLRPGTTRYVRAAAGTVLGTVFAYEPAHCSAATTNCPIWDARSRRDAAGGALLF